MLYEVTLRGPRTAANPNGTTEKVTVEAESGDDAAIKAFQPHRIIIGVHPAPVEPAESAAVDDRAALRAEYEAVLGKKPFTGWSADVLREKIETAKAVDA